MISMKHRYLNVALASAFLTLAGFSLAVSGGCANFAEFQGTALDANAAAIADLEATLAKLPADSPERPNIEKAIAELRKLQATGFDPAAVLFTYIGDHPAGVYGAAGLGILLAVIKAIQARRAAAAAAGTTTALAPKVP